MKSLMLPACLVALAAPAASGAQARVEPSAADAPAGELRVVVSLEERWLWVLAGADTLRSAPVAVASGDLLEYGGRRWRFVMRRGRHVVIGKKADPVWSPPDWHYAEVAREYALRVRALPPGGTTLRDGRRLQVRDSLVVVESEAGRGDFAALPVDEHVVFDDVLYIPPFGTRNRQLEGELGRFALDLGGGFLLHGTPDQESIGTATTHGCIRLTDEDVEWLFAHVPIGTPVLVR